MNSNSIFLLSAVLVLSSNAHADHFRVSSCDGYKFKAKEAQNELDDFVNLVIKPLKSKQLDLQKQLDIEVNEPGRLTKENNRLNTEITQLESKKQNLDSRIAQLRAEAEQLSQEADAAEAAGDKQTALKKRKQAKANQVDANQKERESVKVEGAINTKTARVEANRARIQEILTSDPTEAQIRQSLDAVNAQLADEGKLKSDKISARDLALRALRLCVEDAVLRASIPILVQGRCQNALPYTSDSLEKEAQEVAVSLVCPYL